MGIPFALVGGLLSWGATMMPAWLPIPRIVILGAPAIACLGLAMLVNPGPAQPDGFDFEDWFDEAPLRDRLIWYGSAFTGFAIGLALYLQQGPLSELLFD